MNRRALTENGWVKGLPAADPRITAYKGIPFAAPPVGENRWRAPQPCKDWAGELCAYDFAPCSLQEVIRPNRGDIYTREWTVDPERPMDEDCLYLNIWTPAEGKPVGQGIQYVERDEDDRPAEKLPVFVWYFGGGLQVGATSEMEFDGERIARRGVVVVTVNYRLNVFGFLCHPEITAEAPDAPANFGFLDQQFATQWVKRNISAFGGDPERITIGGQSAGGMSVSAQLANPDNRGLIQGAIIESGMFAPAYPGSLGLDETLAEGEARGKAFFEALGARTLAEARALDARVVLDKALRWNRGPWRCVTGDRFCSVAPHNWYRAKNRVACPVMAGATNNEFFLYPEGSNQAELRAFVQEKLPSVDADSFMDAFAGADDAAAIRARGEVSAIDYALQALCRGKGEGTPLYQYCFAAEIPGWDHPGAFHSSDLWFFFETLAKCWRPFSGKHYDLARQMCDYWANFIRSGDPNGMGSDGRRLPEWPETTAEAPVRMRFTDRCAAEPCAPQPVMAALLSREK